MLRRTPVASLIMSQKSQGRPDSFASTLKVQRSAVGSGSGRHETARPMSQLGRPRRFHRGPANARYRRISPIGALSGNRLLSEPTAGTQPCRREPLFMPHSGRSPAPQGSAQEGGNGPSRFARCPCFESGHCRWPRVQGTRVWTALKSKIRTPRRW
jgi:hypothetical protein